MLVLGAMRDNVGMTFTSCHAQGDASLLAHLTTICVCRAANDYRLKLCHLLRITAQRKNLRSKVVVSQQSVLVAAADIASAVKFHTRIRVCHVQRPRGNSDWFVFTS